MQSQAKYPANPVGSHEAKILSHPGPDNFLALPFLVNVSLAVNLQHQQNNGYLIIFLNHELSYLR